LKVVSSEVLHMCILGQLTHAGSVTVCFTHLLSLKITISECTPAWSFNQHMKWRARMWIIIQQ